MKAKFSRHYQAALRAYLKQGLKASLQPAHGMGRQALAASLQTLDIAKLHEQILVTRVLPGSRNLPNLLLDPNLSHKLMEHQEDLRQVVCQTAGAGVPAPGLMVSLGYLDAYRSAWLPANLIQAQRDYFGAHTYERIDAKGTFHTEWEKD